MTNPNKRKGDQEERDVLGILRASGFPHAERTRAGRREDQGDIFLDVQLGLAPGVVCQVKNVKTPDWSGWCRDLAEQKRLSGAAHAFLSVKRSRPGKPPLRLAVVELDDYLTMVREAGYGTEIEADNNPETL